MIPPERAAHRYLSFYRNLISQYGFKAEWQKGLETAQRFVELAEQFPPDKSAIEAFIHDLERQQAAFGSMEEDMLMHARSFRRSLGL